MRPNIGTAVKSFGLTNFVIEGEPTNEQEFNDMFKLVVGKDETGVAVYADDLSSLPFTWNEVKEKYDQLVAEYPVNLLRVERNKLLEETDWWELPSQLPMSEARAEYRQSLRDITEHYSSLDEVVWPDKP